MKAVRYTLFSVLFATLTAVTGASILIALGYIKT